MPPILFDAVIFDLDGTLVATDRFWIRAARAGATKAFAELGIERALPGEREWMSMVGLPLDEGFRIVFSDLDDVSRKVVQERCMEEEHKALRAGGAALLPDAHEVIDELRASGIKIGIASNCGFEYLDTMCEKLHLYERVDAPRCLDSAGIHDKAGMIEDILESFETRSAVMVGDRAGDRDAAWANGLPHVHLSSGFASLDEDVRCEAIIDGLSGLIPLVNGRRKSIERLLDDLDASVGTIGITGWPASGKTLFARDLARVATERGQTIRVVAIEDHAAPAVEGAPPLERDGLLEHVARRFDLEGFTRELAPAAGELVVCEGPFLAHPRVRKHLDRLVFLEAGDEVLLRRISGRDGRHEGPGAVMRARSELLPLHRNFDMVCPPDSGTDLVLGAESPFGPFFTPSTL